MNLNFDCIASLMESGIDDHPQIIMKNLGITYKRAIPQSLYDSWWFFDCENVPEVLPPYLTELNLSKESQEHWLS